MRPLVTRRGMLPAIRRWYQGSGQVPRQANTSTAMPGAWFWPGLVVLVLAWAGPLPQLTRDSFAAHMTLHVAVVAVAAPLIAIGLSGRRYDPFSRLPAAFAAVAASVVELVIVWTWHTPALRNAASGSTGWFMVEQASFLAVGLAVWMAAFAAGADGGRARALAGIVALLFTSMHMTLLGALLCLSPRPLFHHGGAAAGLGGLGVLEDQQVGGIVMLAVGGLAYLAGGLALMMRLLRDEPAAAPDAVAAAAGAGGHAGGGGAGTGLGARAGAE